MEIKTADNLKAAIRHLEEKEALQKATLINEFRSTVSNLNPVNIIKNTFSELTNNSTLTNTIINTTTGLGAGLLFKELIVGKSNNIFKKIAGTAVERGVANIVAKNSHWIRSAAKKLIAGIFHLNGQEKVKAD